MDERGVWPGQSGLRSLPFQQAVASLIDGIDGPGEWFDSSQGNDAPLVHRLVRTLLDGL
ncbi:hypothetical protein DESC_500036 [Desulfosarcina cetonica]|nr:hypothetical protein DESC_500036 [Desulfosarcina cetonica]